MSEEKLSPAYPDPISPLLALIVRGALEAHQSGEIDIEGAILNAAVNGWYEDHIGGDVCGGLYSPHRKSSQHFVRYPLGRSISLKSIGTWGQVTLEYQGWVYASV
jgi:hypothetical protein